MNYQDHNREVREVWKTFAEGNPIRVPVIAGVSDRFFVLNPYTNPSNISFEQYTKDPDLMFEMQAKFDHYRRFHVVGDHFMGYPEEEECGWLVNVDFQNYYEAAWFGANVCFPDNQVPYAKPILNEDNLGLLFEKGIPDPFSGLMGTIKNYYEHFQERMETFILDGYPVAHIGGSLAITDGPFTVACELVDPTELCILLYEDPDYVHQLMEYLTEATIQRIKAWRRYLGRPEIAEDFGFADDSILLLSKEMYEEFVLPYHKKLRESLSNTKRPGGIHLCGDATRHFKKISEELNINSFDTGFPVKHGELVRELGPDVRINGGPKAELIRKGTREQILMESKRILEEVMPYTKKFVLREGNDIAPYTPLENIQALYDAAKLYGRY